MYGSTRVALLLLVVQLAVDGGLTLSPTPSHTAAPTPGPDVYVSTGGTDAPGCGLQPSKSCASIQQGIDRAAAGATVHVAEGQFVAESVHYKRSPV